MYTVAMTPEERSRSREYTKRAHAKAVANPKPCRNECGRNAAPRRSLCATCRSKEYRNRSETHQTYVSEYRRRVKTEVAEAYGGKCVCCGEGESVFLTLDHVNGDGNQHRKEIGTRNMWAWARQNSFPDTLRLLCFNCNFAEHWGDCPHRKERH